jgi:FtsP/CotA-like multicopper oxidase with cupredoxin domain
MVFEAGRRYLLRLVNVATDGHFQFSIDGHNLTIIANDLVPIVPYEADSVQISIGQRYDVIVEANAASGDYWLRAGWNDACATNANPNEMTGIVRYDSSSSADPTSTSEVTTPASCDDEPLASLVPHVQLNVGDDAITIDQELDFIFDDYFKWTINSSSLYIDWAEPTLVQVLEGNTTYETEYNVIPVNVCNTTMLSASPPALPAAPMLTSATANHRQRLGHSGDSRLNWLVSPLHYSPSSSYFS